MVEQEPQEIAEKKEEARKRGGKLFPVLNFNESLGFISEVLHRIEMLQRKAL